MLSDCGVTRFALNITNLNRAVKSKSWSVPEHLPDGAEWVLYADEKSTWEMAEPFLGQGPSFALVPLDWLDEMTPGEDHPPLDIFVPYYEERLDPAEYYVVALTDEHVKAQSNLRSILSRFNDNTLFAVTGSSRGINRLDAVVTSAWIASQKFGETQVWTGTKFHRYAGSRKAEARPKHRADMERLGIDYALIEADDPEETARLAVLSWMGWEAHQRPVVVPLSSNDDYSDQDGMGSAHRALTSVAPLARHDRDQIVLPVLGLDDLTERSVDGEGVETVTTTQAVRGVGELMRSCNNCFLASRCPAFQRDASCAFKIPVQIRSKDQLQALMRTVIEIQGQRVFFARFAEEIEGQGLDGNVGAEMDRLFKSLQAMKDVNDTRDVLRLEMEARGNAGMLSRLFGANVGEAARALPIPTSSDEVMSRFEQ